MDSEWWKTPRFIYGKGSRKFRKVSGQTEKSPEYSRRGWDRASWASPTQASRTRAGRPGQAEWGRESSPPSMRVGEGEESLLPTPSGVFSFLSNLASWCLNWFGLET